MLLGDAYVERALRKLLQHLVNACAVGHRGCERDDTLVALHQFAHRLPEDRRVLRVRGLRGLDGLAGLEVEGACGVPCVVVLLARGVALALLRERVDDDGAVLDVLGLFERTHQGARVVPVNVADVLEAQLVDERAGQHGRRDCVLHGLRRLVEPLAEGRNLAQRLAHLVLEAVVALRLAYAVQVACERADRGRD